jgi:putative heme iron utilization protein
MIGGEVTTMSSEETPGTTIRRLLREATRASLGTLEVEGGGPYVSLVMLATDAVGAPLLLLSDLADHTRNLKADPRASLLVDGTLGMSTPLAGARATIQGHVQRSERSEDRARYLARHADAEMYLGFQDFNLYRVTVERAHLVAGFGRIHWVPADEVLLRPETVAELAGAEAAIVAHMNDDHSDAVQLYAQRLLGRSGGDWRITGVDAEGADLARPGETARLRFAAPVVDAEGCRAELVRLVRQARQVAA